MPSTPLPGIRGTSNPVATPATRRLEYSTDVVQFVNATEQRWKQRAPLTRLDLPYASLSPADAAAQKTFHASQKGAFDQTATAYFNGTNYANMTLENDQFSVEQRESKLYNTHFQMRQVQNRGFATPSVGTTFPTLANGLITQRPLVRTFRFDTSVSDNPMGPKYTWGWFGYGLAGFPTGALMAWRLTYPVLSDADLATLETFFKGMNGQWGQFTFVDPEDSVSHPKCRFGSDIFEVAYAAPNQSSLSLTVVEFN